MKLFHGSKKIVSKPIPSGSKEDNDYGPAFYTTPDLESAHEWSCRNESVGFVNFYNLSLDDLKILDLTKMPIMNHLAILLHFRKLDSGFVDAFSYRLELIEKHFYIDISKYDVVIGYRADDAYFRFPLDFVRGNLTLEQLEYSYNLGNLGIQYVLISSKAFKKLKYLKSLESDSKYIFQYFKKVFEATKRFNELNKDEDGIRIMDIIRDIKK